MSKETLELAKNIYEYWNPDRGESYIDLIQQGIEKGISISKQEIQILEDKVKVLEQENDELCETNRLNNNSFVELSEQYNSLLQASDSMEKAINHTLEGYLNPEKKLRDSVTNYQNLKVNK